MVEQNMHDSERLHPYQVFCQRCHVYFDPDARDMVRWYQGFSPVLCAKCKEQKKNG